MAWTRYLSVASLGLAMLASSSLEAARPVAWPDVQYDASVPSFEQVLGYAPGGVISSHAQTRQYFDALQSARPEQVRIVPYAQSWEGRELYYVIIGSAAHMARLDSIQTDLQALADPRKTSATQAKTLIEKLPGTAWLSYAVHGNEISSTDAAMMTAYHLLAGTRDDDVQEILDNTLVFIDPLQNPDGRDRFVNAFRETQGLIPDTDRYSAEHDEPWPNGRTNHYHFDMNRDWIALTQPETRGRIEALLSWYPLVFVDLHEMGSDSTYYFAPETVPFNPHIDAAQRNKLTWFGQNNARWFDQFGIDYFTREIFDAFYPGYGASWPLYYGAVAMTYEQASVRGLEVRRRDGEEISYAESVRNHFLSSVSTIQTVARNRAAMLNDFYDYRQSAIEAGEKGPWRSYIFSGQPDPSAAQKLAALIGRQGVEVQQATATFKACGKEYPAGSFAIDLAQPSHRLARTLLDPDVALDSNFVAEQERRREKDLPDEIYDVTAWSLPLMFNVDMDRCKQALRGNFVDASQDWVRPGSFNATDNGEKAVAYLAPWGTQAAARLLTQSLRAGLTVKSTDKAFVKSGREYPAGTLIFSSADNPENLQQQLRQLGSDTGADIVAVANTWVEEGPNFGSDHVQTMVAPRIALAWDEPTFAPGQTRYVLERQYGYPVTPIRTDALRRADLSRYQVLILPETRGSYSSALGESGVQRLRQWIQAGGTLITLGNATRLLAQNNLGLSDLQRERAWQSEATNKLAKAAESNKKPTVTGTRLESSDALRQHLTPLSEGPDNVAGVLANTQRDADHWLAAGLPQALTVLLRGNEVYAPLRLDQGSNVLFYQGADDILAGGHLWEENRLQLAYKPYLTIEPKQRGYVIAFTADPNYRAYLDGLNVAFINAVFRAPAHAAVVH